MRDGKRAALAAALLLGLGFATQSVSPDRPAAIPSAVAASVRATRAPPGTRLPAGTETLRERAVARSAQARTRAALTPALGSAAPPEVTSLPLTSTSPGLAPDEPPARARFRILLEPVSAEPGAVTGSFAGFDTGAPRRLDLWRVDAGRAERLGRVTSDADARIHGPQLALPDAGIELVVTPKGVRPGEPDASQPLRLARASQADGQAPAPGAPRWWHASIQGSEGGLQ